MVCQRAVENKVLNLLQNCSENLLTTQQVARNPRRHCRFKHWMPNSNGTDVSANTKLRCKRTDPRAVKMFAKILLAETSQSAAEVDARCGHPQVSNLGSSHCTPAFCIRVSQFVGAHEFARLLHALPIREQQDIVARILDIVEDSKTGFSGALAAVQMGIECLLSSGCSPQLYGGQERGPCERPPISFVSSKIRNSLQIVNPQMHQMIVTTARWPDCRSGAICLGRSP